MSLLVEEPVEMTRDYSTDDINDPLESAVHEYEHFREKSVKKIVEEYDISQGELYREIDLRGIDRRGYSRNFNKKEVDERTKHRILWEYKHSDKKVSKLIEDFGLSKYKFYQVINEAKEKNPETFYKRSEKRESSEIENGRLEEMALTLELQSGKTLEEV